MMNWKILRFCMASAALAVGGCAGVSGDGQGIDLSSYDRGKQYFNAGQFGTAIKHFQSAVDHDPGSVEALNGLAASYDRIGRFDLSTRYYDRALAADPDSTQTLNNIGYSYLIQKRFDLAVAYLRDAQSRNKEDPLIVANRNVAETALQEADLKRSAEEAAKVAEAPPAVPVEPVMSEPLTRITIATATPQPPAPAARGPVKPWIERTAPSVQTLVTQPQTALVGLAEQAGVSPQLAAYRPRQPRPEELLPDPLSAPMVLDQNTPDRMSALLSPREEMVGADIAGLAEEPAPSQDTSTAVPLAGVLPEEVVVVSLDPTAGLAEDWPGGRQPSDMATTDTGVLSNEARLADLEEPGSEESIDEPAAQATADSVSGLLPVEVTVASLQPITWIETSSKAEIDEQPLVSATGLLPVGVTVSVLDPESGSSAEAPVETAAPARAIGMPVQLVPAEVMVASLDKSVPLTTTVETEQAEPVGQLVPLVEVSNGAGRLSMAARVRSYLENQGVVVQRLTNADHYAHMETTIFYREGWRDYAEDLARRLPAIVDLEGHNNQRSDVRVELGGDLLDFDRDLYYAVGRSGGHSG